MDSSNPKVPPNPKAAQDSKGFPNAKASQSPKISKRILSRKSDSSLGRAATVASESGIKTEPESDGRGLDTKIDARYANCANCEYQKKSFLLGARNLPNRVTVKKHGLKRKREASEFVIKMMSSRKNQLDEIDKEMTAAKARRVQIEKDQQKSGQKLQEAKTKVEEIQKAHLNYPFRMKEAQMEIEAIKKRRDDLLDSVDSSTFTGILGASEEV
ncbi:uncharacterized protein N7483_010610 [Penicillium malachiteum]|uniref:uncharacterized protein n=1 Tax=Penicillium malachiteum TaxID=1324776 RepID=UPI002548E6B7|nr:uncharacterized protein N7483_010610 [Penicillium malachiteum]KAJ5713429.1 hypothetical protein N7483_010610 [Penicillium malachiteum]